MYKLCKTEQSANRQRLLEEGLLLAMSSKRYEEITVCDLCDQMGIPRKSFYRYFSSKDGALYALIDDTLLEFEQTCGFLSGTGYQDPDLKGFYEFWYRHRLLLDVLAKSGLGGILTARAITKAQTEYNVSSRVTDVSPQVRHFSVSFGICGLMCIMGQWHAGGCRETPEEMAAVTEQILSTPLVHLVGKN